MKKLLLSLLCFSTLICMAQSTKFEKPRYLKNGTFLCPIDMSKSYLPNGLLRENSATITIQDSPNKVYETRKDNAGADVQVEKKTQDTILAKTIFVDKGYAFDVVQEIGSFSIIKFWDLKKSTGKSFLKSLRYKGAKTDYADWDLTKTYAGFKTSGLIATDGTEKFNLTETYYIVPTKTLVNNSVEFEDKNNTWNIGLLVMPVKVRPFATESGQFDFSDGVSVGTTLSWTVHHNFRTNFTHNLLLYVGISSYTADSTKIKEVRNDYKIAAFSPAVGWMWEKNSIQLSVLTGIDFPSGNIQKNWVYRNMPWFGLGIGVGLFKIDSNKKTEDPKQ